MIDAGRRLRASIVVHTAQTWDVHHLCALIGYGASAVNPYMAIATVRSLSTETATEGDLVENFLRVAEAGIRKVMSKMGI